MDIIYSFLLIVVEFYFLAQVIKHNKRFNIKEIFLNLPFIVNNSISNISWRYIFIFFAIFILSSRYIFELNSGIHYYNSDFFSFKLNFFLYIIAPTILYFIAIVIYQKRYSMLKITIKSAFIFAFFVALPMVFNIYFLLYQIYKKPYSLNLTGYLCYTIYYDSYNEKFKSKFSIFNINNKNIAYIDIKNDYPQYTNKISSLLEYKKNSMIVDTLRDIDSCKKLPCKIITPYDVKVNIKIEGYKAFGHISTDNISIEKIATQPSEVDRYTYKVIKLKKIYTKDIIILTLPTTNNFKVKDRVALLSGVGVALDINKSKFNKIHLKPELINDGYIHLYNKDFFNINNMPKYIQEFNRYNIKEQIVFTTPLYTIPIDTKGSISVDKNSSKKLNFYRVKFIDSSYDNMINYYEILRNFSN